MFMKSLYRRWIDHRYTKANYRYRVLTEFLDGLNPDLHRNEIVIARAERQRYARTAERLYPKTTQYQLDKVELVYPSN